MKIGIKPWGSNKNKPVTMPSDWPEFELVVDDQDAETFFENHPVEDGWLLVELDELNQRKLRCIESYETHLKSQANIAKHDSARRYISQVIRNARTFGQQLIDDFGARNVLSGYNEQTIMDISARLAPVQIAIQSGSLKTAKMLFSAIDCSDFMTEEEKAAWIASIDDYIGGA